MSTALIFPGQGSQTVGMGKNLVDSFPAAKYVFEEINDALEQKLSEIIFEGPEKELRLTENAQPALLCMSMAILAVLKSNFDIDLPRKSTFVAGHSLGEYSALAAVGTFSLFDAARLLKKRGLAMQKAVPVGEGAMAAIIGLELADVEIIVSEVAQNEILAVANDNAPGQVVISGTKNAVERAIGSAKTKGAKRALLLPVSAPFHCPLMEPAAKIMSDALEKTEMFEPSVPLVSNIAAVPIKNLVEIRELLVQQVTGRVRWRESVQYMKSQGVGTLIELGAGKVLSGITKRIDRNLESYSVDSLSAIEKLAEKLKNI